MPYYTAVRVLDGSPHGEDICRPRKTSFALAEKNKKGLPLGESILIDDGHYGFLVQHHSVRLEVETNVSIHNLTISFHNMVNQKALERFHGEVVVSAEDQQIKCSNKDLAQMLSQINAESSCDLRTEKPDGIYGNTVFFGPTKPFGTTCDIRCKYDFNQTFPENENVVAVCGKNGAWVVSMEPIQCDAISPMESPPTFENCPVLNLFNEINPEDRIKQTIGAYVWNGDANDPIFQHTDAHYFYYDDEYLSSWRSSSYHPLIRGFMPKSSVPVGVLDWIEDVGGRWSSGWGVPRMQCSKQCKLSSLSPPENGQLKCDHQTKNAYYAGQVCEIECNQGYKLSSRGNVLFEYESYLRGILCDRDGRWRQPRDVQCIPDEETPLTILKVPKSLHDMRIMTATICSIDESSPVTSFVFDKYPYEVTFLKKVPLNRALHLNYTATGKFCQTVRRLIPPNEQYWVVGIGDVYVADVEWEGLGRVPRALVVETGDSEVAPFTYLMTPAMSCGHMFYLGRLPQNDAWTQKRYGTLVWEQRFLYGDSTQWVFASYANPYRRLGSNTFQEGTPRTHNPIEVFQTIGWPGVINMTEIANCGVLPPIPHGNHTCRFSHPVLQDHSCSLSCEPGYITRGDSAQTTCQSDGTFSSELECILPCVDSLLKESIMIQFRKNVSKHSPLGPGSVIVISPRTLLCSAWKLAKLSEVDGRSHVN